MHKSPITWARLHPGTVAPAERREWAIRLAHSAAALSDHDALSLTAVAAAASLLDRPAEEIERLIASRGRETTSFHRGQLKNARCPYLCN